jgi:membrane protein DedA with SNARE-associated domain
VHHLLVFASITEPLVNLATNVVGDLGLAGVFVLMVLESACIPVPSEATMLFAGFNVSLGHYSLLEATLVGASANLVGSWIAYGIGYFGRIELIEKHGGKLHISPRQLAQADRWFERHGSAAVLVTRMLPIVRTFISLPAGVARMPFVRFSLLTFLGCLPWVFVLTFIGKEAQDNWTAWKESLHYVDYAVAVTIVAAAGYYGVRWWRRRGGSDDDGVGGPAEPAPLTETA